MAKCCGPCPDLVSSTGGGECKKLSFPMNLRNIVVFGKDDIFYRVLAFDGRGKVLAYLTWPDDPEDESLLEFRRIGIDPLLVHAKDAATDLAVKHGITAIQQLSPWPFHD